MLRRRVHIKNRPRVVFGHVVGDISRFDVTENLAAFVWFVRVVSVGVVDVVEATLRRLVCVVACCNSIPSWEVTAEFPAVWEKRRG